MRRLRTDRRPSRIPRGTRSPPAPRAAPLRTRSTRAAGRPASPGPAAALRSPATPRRRYPPDTEFRPARAAAAGSTAHPAPAARRPPQSPAGRVSSSCGDPRGNAELGDDDPRAGALPRNAVELQLIVGAVNNAQALVDVAQSDARAFHAPGLGRCDPDAVVDHVDDRMVPFAQAANRHPPLAEFLREAVLDRVLDQRLQHHARDDQVQGRRVDVFLDLELRPEP